MFLAFDLSVEDLVRRTPELSPERYKQLRTTTVGQIWQARFQLLASIGRITTSFWPTSMTRRAALQWADLQGDRLTVDKAVELVRTAEPRKPQLRLSPTKTANRRRLRLDPQTLAEFTALQAERQEISPFVFSLEPGPPSPARIGWWWTRARKAAGIDPKWRLHDLRHWTATAAIGGGHDVRTVAGRLGHANPAMTMRVYAHVVEGADQAIASTLGQALDGELP